MAVAPTVEAGLAGQLEEKTQAFGRIFKKNIQPMEVKSQSPAGGRAEPFSLVHAAAAAPGQPFHEATGRGVICAWPCILSFVCSE